MHRRGAKRIIGGAPTTSARRREGRKENGGRVLLRASRGIFGTIEGFGGRLVTGRRLGLARRGTAGVGGTRLVRGRAGRLAGTGTFAAGEIIQYIPQLSLLECCDGGRGGIRQMVALDGFTTFALRRSTTGSSEFTTDGKVASSALGGFSDTFGRGEFGAGLVRSKGLRSPNVCKSSDPTRRKGKREPKGGRRRDNSLGEDGRGKEGITLVAVEDWGDRWGERVVPVGVCRGCTRSIVPRSLIRNGFDVRFPILQVSQRRPTPSTNTTTWTEEQTGKREEYKFRGI